MAAPSFEAARYRACASRRAGIRIGSLILILPEISPRFAVFARIAEEGLPIVRGIGVEREAGEIHHSGTEAGCSSPGKMPPETAFAVFHGNSSGCNEHNTVRTGEVSRWNESDRLASGFEGKIDVRRRQSWKIACD